MAICQSTQRIWRPFRGDAAEDALHFEQCTYMQGRRRKNKPNTIWTRCEAKASRRVSCILRHTLSARTIYAYALRRTSVIRAPTVGTDPSRCLQRSALRLNGSSRSWSPNWRIPQLAPAECNVHLAQLLGSADLPVQEPIRDQRTVIPCPLLWMRPIVRDLGSTADHVAVAWSGSC